MCHYETRLRPHLTYQASSVGVDGVRGVDKLQAVFGVFRELVVVVEPAVQRSREALVLQTPQLGRRSYCDRLWDAAARYYRFHCTQTNIRHFLLIKLLICFLSLPRLIN